MAVPLRPFIEWVERQNVVCPLTPCQLRAMWCMARYGTQAKAARRVPITMHTISHHLEHARHRLGVDETVVAIAVAIERSWIPPVTLDLGFNELYAARDERKVEESEGYAYQ